MPKSKFWKGRESYHLELDCYKQKLEKQPRLLSATTQLMLDSDFRQRKVPWPNAITWKKQDGSPDGLATLIGMTLKKGRDFFFAALRKKANSPELFGPIRNKSGTLSNSLSECLENWADFYENLYKGEPKIFLNTSGENPKLDEPFTYEELVLSVNEFRDSKTPGRT